MMHVNASSHINKTIMHQVFVLYVRTNSTDIVVKAIEHQKYVILLQVQVYICYQNRIRKKTYGIAQYLEHSLNHTEILNDGSEKVYGSMDKVV